MKVSALKKATAKVTAIVAGLSLLLSACGTTSSTPETSSSNGGTTVAGGGSEASAPVDTHAEDTNAEGTEGAEGTGAEGTEGAEAGSGAGTIVVTDIHGEVEVPVRPEKVVSLDSRTFETLADWGIALVAAPKDVMPADSPYVSDPEVLNIGNHREPNLEILAAAEPDLVIIGQRFAAFYEEIKMLVPGAAVIDLNFALPEENAGESLVQGLKGSTETLGRIFGKEQEAAALGVAFDEAISEAKAAYNGSTVMTVIVSGGTIGFSAPRSGRVWGPMYEIFDWVSALEVAGASSDHQGDDISVEAIAQSNPDWIFVLDRDAGVATAAGEQPARDVIDHSPALRNTTAVLEGNIYYAPNDTYTNESIQTYVELFRELAAALAK